MGINFISGLRDKKFFHDFHMVFDQERVGKLKGFIRLFENIQKFWELIEFLLEYLYLFLEEEHFCGLQKESRYKLIHEDKEVKRMHVHLFLPERVYRRIKMIHHDLNSFSMAQVIRIVIDKFLSLAGELGEGVCDYLKKIQEEWEKLKEKHRRNKKPIRTIHMSKNKRTTSNRNQKIVLKIHYSNNFSPHEIYLL